jgi:hypothetical protein
MRNMQMAGGRGGIAPPGIGYPPQVGGFNGQAAKPPNPPHSNIVKLGWQCRDLCLSATPPKRQTFVSVADMSQHVGPTRRRHSVKSAFFRLSGSCRGRLLPIHFPTCT